MSYPASDPHITIEMVSKNLAQVEKQMLIEYGQLPSTLGEGTRDVYTRLMRHCQRQQQHIAIQQQIMQIKSQQQSHHSANVQHPAQTGKQQEQQKQQKQQKQQIQQQLARRQSDTINPDEKFSIFLTDVEVVRRAVTIVATSPCSGEAHGTQLSVAQQNTVLKNLHSKINAWNKVLSRANKDKMKHTIEQLEFVNNAPYCRLCEKKFTVGKE